MKRDGFTVIEILTVVIILAILATLAVPPFIRTMEAAKGRLAKTNLKLIYAAEKVYRNEVGAYMPIAGARLGAEANEFKKYLGLDLKEDQFEYEVDTTAGSTASFQATATRKGKTLTIDKDGSITGTYP